MTTISSLAMMYTMMHDTDQIGENNMKEQDNCQVVPLEKPLDKEALSKAMVAYLAVGGMGCPRCAM